MEAGQDARRLAAEREELLLVIDRDESLRIVGAPAESMLGWPPALLEGQPLARLVPETTRRIGASSFAAHVLGRTGSLDGDAVRATLVRREGVQIDVFVAGTAATLDGEEVTVLAVRPLPEVPDSTRVPVGRDAELSLARALPGHGLGRTEQLFRVLFDQAPLGVLYFDEEGVVTACNPKLIEMLGSSKEAILGLHLLTLPDQQLIDAIGCVLQGKTGSYAGDYHSVTGGTVVPIEASYAPILDREGVVAGGVGIIRDVSLRRQAEEERDRLYREAQDAVRVRDRFLSIASHELKTPLTPLSVWLAMIERKVARAEAVEPALVARARQSLDKLAVLINDLLDVARITAGHFDLQRKRVLLDEVVRRAAAQMTGGSHELRVELPGEPVEVWGDAARLEQVVANLLDNAAKYSPPGTTIELRVERRDEWAVICVTDHGIGIPPDQIPYLFDRYFRARNAESRIAGGLGLGLYISRDIVDRHGGKLQVKSELGVGSTFSVALPRHQSRSSR